MCRSNGWQMVLLCQNSQVKISYSWVSDPHIERYRIRPLHAGLWLKHIERCSVIQDKDRTWFSCLVISLTRSTRALPLGLLFRCSKGPLSRLLSRSDALSSEIMISRTDGFASVLRASKSQCIVFLYPSSHLLGHHVTTTNIEKVSHLIK